MLGCHIGVNDANADLRMTRERQERTALAESKRSCGPALSLLDSAYHYCRGFDAEARRYCNGAAENGKRFEGPEPRSLRHNPK